MKFCHLHCHTQYSLLDGAAKISSLINKTKTLGMDALAITDHGNMFGVPHFVNEASKAGVKPIIGCEFYLADNMHDKKNSKRYHQILLAKNEQGYRNISKLSSLGFIEGYYYKPRIDINIVKKYSAGLIATTCCLASKVNQSILKHGENEAEKVFLEWLDIFGEDYYIELQRHGLEEMDFCNEVLLKWSQKHNVKAIATNDVHYINQEDSIAQDVLLCLQTGKDYDDPARMRFDSNKFYLKSPQEMSGLFKDIPQAIDNTNEIVSKIQTPSLLRDILMPIFKIPEGVASQDEYLRQLTLEGAKKIYQNLSSEIEERINFELEVLTSMGFAGYFLIVQDFVNAARKQNVIVGPGRGSVAGSLVAYCLGITEVDPIKYNLFFERFLNPERVSMPDIDIDFDDEGRQKVIDYVVDKYGKNQVAQIITFGSMAAKSAIRDVSRVLGVPLSKADYMAKLIPDKLGTTLSSAFKDVSELKDLKSKVESPEGKVLALAETLEGSARHTGIHAAGIIIAPEDLTNLLPVKTDKDSDLLVTQYDGSVVESIGMLKMDFLGLKTLSIIKDAITLINKNRSIKNNSEIDKTITDGLITKDTFINENNSEIDKTITDGLITKDTFINENNSEINKKVSHNERDNVPVDIKNIPLDDKKTFELYQKGDTIATFQFESDGMRSWLTKLMPTEVEDLIAMNALYRPGPMQFIPNFIERRHGREKVEYPHKLLENILKNTYGIMVYQEQIMQTAQIIAGYTLGEADLLRRAMGKKKVAEMARQKSIFIKGAKETNDIKEETAEEIFSMMEKFAQYGFNRAHSAAYSIIAYQTAYLKANFTAEYMAAVLAHNLNDIGKISHFLDECKHQKIKVLGPCVNESSKYFDVIYTPNVNDTITDDFVMQGASTKKNKKVNLETSSSTIRFGLAAIKGAGEAAVNAVIEERNRKGPFASILDFVERVNLRKVNKKTVEALCISGALDEFGYHRNQYIEEDKDGSIFIEKLLSYANKVKNQKNSMQQSLFVEPEVNYGKVPAAPECEPLSDLEKLRMEKEVVGFYISGHPLDHFKLELKYFCTANSQNFINLKNREATIGGIITDFSIKQTKTGKSFIIFSIEDYYGSMQMALFGEDFRKNQHLIHKGEYVYISGRVQERYKNPGMWEFRPRIIEPLHDVRGKFIKKVSLDIDIDTFNNIDPLLDVLEQYPGKCPLTLNIKSHKHNMNVDAAVKKYRVDSKNELFEALDNISVGYEF